MSRDKLTRSRLLPSGIAAALAVGVVLLGPAVARPAATSTIAVKTSQELEAAIAGAQPGDEIVLAASASAYAPTKPLSIGASVTLRSDGSGPGVRIVGSNLPLSSPSILVIGAGADVTLKDISLTTTATQGAALVVNGKVAIEGVAVSGNAGNGIAVKPGGSARLVSATVSGNLGFGLVVQGVAELVNVTVSHNGAGGIAMNRVGSVTVKNVIVAANGRDCDGRVAESAASLDTDGTCGVQIAKKEPRLGPLTLSNGGTTPTRAVLAGSPAIDAGSDCPAADQRHAPRSGACDLGAYEFGSTPPAVATVGAGGGSGDGAGAGSAPDPPAAGGTPGTSASSFPALVGEGVVTVGKRRATFALRAIAGRPESSSVSFAETKRVRLTRVKVKRVSFEKRLTRWTMTGNATNAVSGAKVGFTVVARDGTKDALAVRLSSGYRLTGIVVKGGLVGSGL